MNNICLNPKFVTIDFEQVAINVMKFIFPNATIKGCNFHFNKCICTKLQDLGFQSAFINNKSSDINETNIRNLYKKTCALAFMPPQEVSKLWVMIHTKLECVACVVICDTTYDTFKFDTGCSLRHIFSSSGTTHLSHYLVEFESSHSHILL